MGWVNARWICIHVGSAQVWVIGMIDSESFQSLCVNKDGLKKKLASLLSPWEKSQLAKGI